MPRTLPRRSPALGARLIIGLMLLISPVRAEGRLEVVAKFTTGTSALSVARYTDPGAERSQRKVGLIGISSPGRNSFAFNHHEWTKLIALCDKAIATRSAAWQQVGAMTETGTADVARLTVSAGPGVGFVISSPKAGAVSYIVTEADLPRLKKGLREVGDYLAR